MRFWPREPIFAQEKKRRTEQIRGERIANQSSKRKAIVYSFQLGVRCLGY
jgi:hypothetical protein